MVGVPGAAVPGLRSVPSRVTFLRCPVPLCPHVEFALAAEAEQPVSLRWTVQEAAAPDLTATIEMPGRPGIGARLAARLRRLGPLWFEVVEESSAHAGPERYSYTPALGLFRADLDPAGEVTVGEGRLRALLHTGRRAAGAAWITDLEGMLGTAWDTELEPLRRGNARAETGALRRTG